jgi:hypothetical protein
MSQTEVATSTSVERLGKIPQYTQVPETVHELDWADLATLDLSKFDVPGGKQELAQKLQNAIQQIGISFPSTQTPLSADLTLHRLLLYNQLRPLSR